MKPGAMLITVTPACGLTRTVVEGKVIDLSVVVVHRKQGYFKITSPSES